MKNLIKILILFTWAGVSIPAIKIWRGFNWLAPSIKEKIQFVLFIAGLVVGILAVCLLVALVQAALL